jgi:Helix-turn-helix
MENNIITETQALRLIDSWGAEFWRRIPSRAVKSVLGLYSLTDAAKELGVTVQCLGNYLYDGRVPKPSVMFNKAKFYTAAELKKIKDVLPSLKRPPGRPRKEVVEIRAKWLSGVSQKELGKEYGVSQGTVSRIVRGER